MTFVKTEKAKPPKKLRPGVEDFRVSIGWRAHWKRAAMLRALGPLAVLAVEDLWAFTAEHKPNGELRGMTDEMIEAAAGWTGESGAFVAKITEYRLLDKKPNHPPRIHDWKVWQPWAAGARDRVVAATQAGKASALKRKGVNGSLDSVERPVNPVPSRPVPSRPDPTRPVPTASRAADPAPPDPPDPPLPVREPGGLRLVGEAWFARQKNLLDGKPLLLVEQLLDRGMSSAHVIASFHAAADAVAAGTAQSLRGAWLTIAEETAEGGEYTWGRRAESRGTTVTGERAMSARDVLAMTREPVPEGASRS